MPDDRLQSRVTSSHTPVTGGVTSPVSTSGQGSFTKEQEPIPGKESIAIEPMGGELELTPELERAGAEIRSETIVLPPEMKKMGIQSVGNATPVTTTTVQLPLSDDQIVTGLHAQIISSIRWLAEWGIRLLKKTHYHLKIIAGHGIRERDQ